MQMIEMFKFRLTAAELQAFREAAEACGLNVSAWMRTRLRDIATREAAAMGHNNPFKISRVAAICKVMDEKQHLEDAAPRLRKTQNET